MDFAEFTKQLKHQEARLYGVRKDLEEVHSQVFGGQAEKLLRALQYLGTAQAINENLMAMVAALPRMIAEQEIKEHILEVLRSPEAASALVEDIGNETILACAVLRCVEQNRYPRLRARFERLVRSITGLGVL